MKTEYIKSTVSLVLLGLLTTTLTTAYADSDLFGFGGVVEPAFTAPSAQTSGSPMSRSEQERRLTLTVQATEFVHEHHLPIEIAGFSSDMSSNEDYELYRGRQPGMGAILLNPHLWIDQRLDENHSYLYYTLFRAAADYYYRRTYDGDRCAWVVASRENPASPEDWMHVLKSEFSQLDQNFRNRMDPQGNPDKIFTSLVHYALSAVEQRRADLWALALYRRHVSFFVPGAVQKRMDEHERVLASDYARALYAMTLPERQSFRQVVKSPELYQFQVLSASASRPTGVEPVSQPSDETESAEPLLALAY